MTINPLDTLQRKAVFAHAEATEWDLVVIGGGITGAGIALDAASRGLKTLLLEKRDYASGTSSRSTKLIHGGLRYLKQFEFALVRQVGRERAILHHNAPHLVIPEQLLLPLYKSGSLGKLSTSFGLWLYDRLAGVKRNERRIMLDSKAALAHEPLLNKEGLKGAGLYWEYRTDDARLTLSVLKTAVKKGALCLNYSSVNDFELDENKQIRGLECEDQLTSQKHRIRAKTVVNAAGPWVDFLRDKDHSLSGKRLHHTKGVHIVIPHVRLPLNHPVYFDTPDGRMIFAIPRDGKTYVGTTDTNFKGNLEEPPVSAQDLDYLLNALNVLFPSTQLAASDVESSWAGIRPLIHEDGKSPSELSRKDEVFHSPSGLVTIAGGKLTGYRLMARKTVDIIAKRLAKKYGIPFKPSISHHIPLASTLWDDGLPETPDQKLESLIAAAIGEEGVVFPADFLVRRTGLLYFDHNLAKKLAPKVLPLFHKLLDWDDKLTEKAGLEMNILLENAVNFENS